MRVVSLLPSATEMLHFVGAGDTLVGVTHECDYPPGVESLPTLTRALVDSSMRSAEIDAAIGRLLADTGSVYALDAELLAELSPDLILTQSLCEACAVSPDLVERAVANLPDSPRILSLNPTTVEDVLRETVQVGEEAGMEDEARRRAGGLRERLARLQDTVHGLGRPRTACVEWLDPPFTAGHWVPEMVRIAGGEDVLAEPGEPSRRTEWAEIFRAAPEVLVIMPCGFDAERAAGDAGMLLDLPGWVELPAARRGRVWAVNANAYFSRPGPRFVEGVEILAHILHPESFPDAPGPHAARQL